MNAPTPLPAAENDQSELVDLVSRAQEGDREAFGELFMRFERHVLAIAIRRLGNFVEAQELAQDVFVQALMKIGQLRQPEAFAAWLRSITNRMAINTVMRKNHHEVPFGEVMDDFSAIDVRTPLQDVEEEEDAMHVRAALDTLVHDRRTAELFYIHGKSLNSIVEILSVEKNESVPLGTVKRQLHTARKRVAKVLTEQYGFEY